MHIKKRHLQQGLWQHRDFRKLWLGQAISEVGSRISREGIPLTAVMILGAGPLTMAWLRIAASAPVLLLGLVAGVLIDRLRRRPFLIAADLLRALLLLTIPAAALFSLLHLWLLLVVTGCASALALFFEVAYQSYVPSLVTRELLPDANNKLGLSASVAEILGPAVTGGLVQVFTAPFAIAFDALSYLISAVLVWRIRTPEIQQRPAASEITHWLRNMTDGLRVIIHDRHLLALLAVEAILALFGNMIWALYTLFAIRSLGLSPALFGVTVACGGIGAVAGVAVSARLIRRFGLGVTLIGSLLANALAALLIPLAGGPLWRATACLMGAQFFGDFTGVIYEVHGLTLRQMRASDDVLGRVNAGFQLTTATLALSGGLLGGLFGEWFGIRPTLVIAVCGLFGSAAWLLASPVRKLRSY
ncbi:MAG: MFS transporter [Bacilli bacterium]